ncbi:hypothetical protein [Sporosarcina limicola]|uniref:Peptidase E n=1 Tax=Sporosarcina limicola TaxID=34101 RepID=A0A927MME3_9BACL|nr:hypothetical protein [Sporosarcina limicola]MBE1555567.1 peptidase E [Sporosarcina limicola]
MRLQSWESQDGELERRPAYHKLIASKNLQSGIAVDDGVAVHYIEEEISEIVSSRQNAKAYEVFFDEMIIEKELRVEFLGSC